MNLPLVSICIPVYNGEKYLKECLVSAVGQTYSNTEIIIVDDKSNDQSVSMVRQYAEKDKRIKLFVNEKNVGLVGNWNRCLEYANGEWIKFIFQDDYLKPVCIERMVSVANENIQMVAVGREFIYEKSVSEFLKKYYSSEIKDLKTILNITAPGFIDAEIIAGVVSKLVDRNFIGEPTAVMFRKSIIKKIGVFNSMLVQLSDLDYWLRISTNFGMYYIPETLAFFRIHEESLSASNRATGKDFVDRIVLTFDFLNNDHYKKLRSNMSKFGAAKIWEMFKLRIHEVELALLKNPGNINLTDHYSMIKKAIPVISNYQKPSWRTKLIYSFVKLGRKIYN